MIFVKTYDFFLGMTGDDWGYPLCSHAHLVWNIMGIELIEQPGSLVESDLGGIDQELQ